MKIQIYDDEGKLIDDVEFDRGIIHVGKIQPNGIICCTLTGAMGSYEEKCRLLIAAGSIAHQKFQDSLKETKK